RRRGGQSRGSSARRTAVEQSAGFDGECAPGNRGATGFSWRQSRLSGGSARRLPAARGGLGGGEHPAGRRGLALSAAGPLPRAWRMRRPIQKIKRPGGNNNEDTDNLPAGPAQGVDRCRGRKRGRLGRIGGAGGERGHAATDRGGEEGGQGRLLYLDRLAGG